MRRSPTKASERKIGDRSKVSTSMNLIRVGSLLSSRGAARVGAALAERADSGAVRDCRSRRGCSMGRARSNQALQLTRAAGPNGQPEAADCGPRS